MHHDIHYTQGTEEEKRAEALKDVREWLGAERYLLLVEAAAYYVPQAVRVWMGFAGVQGYPVEVFIDKYCLPWQDPYGVATGGALS